MSALPTPQGVTIYYWPCSLVLLAPSLLLDRPTSPLCATVRISCTRPYLIEVDGEVLTSRAALVAPKAARKRVAAINSDIALFYLPVNAPENQGLKAVLGDRPVVELDIAGFEPYLPRILAAMHEPAEPEEIQSLARAVVATIVGKQAPPPPRQDPRVTEACRILDATPLCDVRLADVARQICISPARLRELFRAQTGFTLGEYARWRAVWRAALLWKRGLTLTEVAVEAGFHDLAHADRAFNEVFGMNPSSVIDPRFVRLVNCELP